MYISIKKFLFKYISKFLNLINYSINRTDVYLWTDSEVVISRLFPNNQNIIIFDIGAHVGESAIKYKKIYKNSKIYSFEPFQDNFNILKKNKIKKFNPYNIGFSDKNSDQTFYVNKGSATNSLLKRSQSAKKIWGGTDWYDPINKVKCKFYTLDAFCLKNQIKNIDFCKIDVQGAEFKVLRGARRLLLNKIIKVIQIEVIIGNTYKTQKTLSYYLKLFENYGYKLKMISDFNIVNDNLVQVDIFFTKKNF